MLKIFLYISGLGNPPHLPPFPHPPPLTQRRALQELVLSTRTLIYDPGLLTWECHSMHSSERSPIGGFARHGYSIKKLQNAIASTETAHYDFFDSCGHTPYVQASFWKSIVEDYCSRNLTEYSDKLMAMAGIVQMLVKRTSDVYLAGLWKRQLQFHLLWSCWSDGRYQMVNRVVEPLPHRAEVAVAPSWSWASVTVPVAYTGASTDPICEILSTHIDGPWHRQMGSVTLHGDTRILHTMHNSKSVWADAERLSQSSKYTTKGRAGQFRKINLSNTMLASTRPCFFSSVETIPARWRPDEIVDPDTPVTFIAIAHNMSGRPKGVSTLALVPTGHRDGEYRRVGFAEWDSCSWYGFDCATDRDLSKIYQKMSKSWGRIKPPVLGAYGTHKHPVHCNPLPVSEVYHPSVKVRRVTLTIV